MFWVYVVKLIFGVILTELLTELAVKSEIFKPLRERVKKWGSWFNELLGCGYCFSVWVAFGVAALLGLSYDLTSWYGVNLTLTALVIHRLSNYLHNFNDKYLDKYYDMRYINSAGEPEGEE